jgi:hypothetical protein
MIKILSAAVIADSVVHLMFSDGSEGDYDLSALIERDTVMVRPLRDSAFIRRCFVELGALCWPNGFELSAESLHRKLAAQGALRRSDAA